MPSVKLIDIKWDASIYPREKPSSTVIEEYADALIAGATFPPISLEDGTNRLLDGYHRWKAHAKVIEDNPDDAALQAKFCSIVCEKHVVPKNIPPKLYAASLSSKHGHRLKAAEIKALAREICEENPDFASAIIAEFVGKSRQAVDGYVQDIKARRQEQQQAIILRLSRLGWTQEEIGDVVGVEGQHVGRLLNKMPEMAKSSKTLLDSGLPPMDVAERFKLPLVVVWSIMLEGLDDEKRAEKLDIKIQPYDVWNFAACHDLFGKQHPGRIPGQLIAHVLYFFTQQGDLVIDPMAGSGTTQDVCLAMGRKCYGYDLDARHERHDTISHDLKTGWPERLKKADLIFWDPPYFSKMDSSNIGQEGYIEGSISKLDRDQYLQFFLARLNEAADIVKKGTRLAFLMSDWDDNTGQQEGIFLWDYADIIRQAGWKLIRQIQVPLSTQQVHPDIVKKFRASKRLARLERYLLIGTRQ